MDTAALRKHASRFEHDVRLPKLFYERLEIVDVAGAICVVEHRITSACGFNVPL
jgi:hypothetical protein